MLFPKNITLRRAALAILTPRIFSPLLSSLVLTQLTGVVLVPHSSQGQPSSRFLLVLIVHTSELVILILGTYAKYVGEFRPYVKSRRKGPLW